MLRVRMFDIAAILLLPPLICQLSNCSASINGGFSGKAAVENEPMMAVIDCRSSALRLCVWLFDDSDISLF